MDDFFHFVSKMVIVIPIVIIIFALILRFNQKEDYSKKIIPSPTVVPTKTSVITPSFKLDLVGPLVCQINEKTASVSAFIKDKKVFATKREKDKVDYFLLIDDCFYWWEKGKYSGQKICGVGFYLSYFEEFSRLGSMGMGDLNLSSLLSSCQKQEIKDETIFNLPQNVLFKNMNFFLNSR